jgi:NADH-quinone oxidoreductase subunit L
VEALRAQFPAHNFTLLAVVLALPLLGAFVNGVFGKRLGKDGVRLMALSALGGAFIASLMTFLLLPKGHEGAAEHLTWTAWKWFEITGRMQQTIPIEVAFSVDGMTATMMLVVTGVGFLIHLYSSEYMRKDPGYHRFFAYLNLFCFAMLTLIMADNMAVLFVGWEWVCAATSSSASGSTRRRTRRRARRRSSSTASATSACWWRWRSCSTTRARCASRR